MDFEQQLRAIIRTEVRAALDDWQPPARPLTYSVTEVAGLVGTSQRTIRAEIHAGRLRALDARTKEYRVPAVELDRWIAERTAAQGGEA